MPGLNTFQYVLLPRQPELATDDLEGSPYYELSDQLFFSRLI